LAVEELMRFYHVTTADAARSILAESFRDGEGVYLADERGVTRSPSRSAARSRAMAANARPSSRSGWTWQTMPPLLSSN
jgi:hypothetical protein